MKSTLLICGLPGSGKTTLAKALCNKNINNSVLHLNADDIRKKYNDWDFSINGRFRQAERMAKLTEESMHEIVICDFVAPLKEIRKSFPANIIVWMNTIKIGRFDNTNKLFEPAFEDASVIVSSFNNIDKTIDSINNMLLFNLRETYD